MQIKTSCPAIAFIFKLKIYNDISVDFTTINTADIFLCDNAQLIKLLIPISS